MMCERFGGDTRVLTKLMREKFNNDAGELDNMVGKLYENTVWKEHDLTRLCGTPPRRQHFWIPFGICIFAVGGYFGWKKYRN